MRNVLQYSVFAVFLYSIFCVWLHATGADATQAQPVPRSDGSSKGSNKPPAHNGSQYSFDIISSGCSHPPSSRASGTRNVQEELDMFGVVAPITEVEAKQFASTPWPQESQGAGDNSKGISMPPVVHSGSAYRFQDSVTISSGTMDAEDMFSLVAPIDETELSGDWSHEPTSQKSQGAGDSSAGSSRPPVQQGPQYRLPENFHIVTNPHGPGRTEQETVGMFGIGAPANAMERGWGKVVGSPVMEELLYIRLMGEGTDVFRPVLAKRFENRPDVYQILMSNSYDTVDELWEFFPGNLVRVKARVLGGKWVFVATALVE